VFGRCAPRRGQPILTNARTPLPVSKCFHYLGNTVLHSTGGARPAVEHLRRAPPRALLSLQSRCCALRVADLASRSRRCRPLMETRTHIRAEVWSPDLTPSLHLALLVPLQASQNDCVRRLGGLHRAVPAALNPRG
jgi:hypothetical protein